ncbi:AI-2E family transporter [Pelotomaculum propionicicum]|uniref:AI-2E family transporter n=1 Tax=Pelotomaculum propionicicum TaxID=258475 RepID=UPI003B80109F
MRLLAWWKDRKILRFFILTALAVAVVYFLYLLRGLFFSFALAVLLSYLINPLAGAISKKGAPRVAAILWAYLALFLVMAGFLMYGFPLIIKQLNMLVEAIPQYTIQAHEITQSIQDRYSDLGMPDGMKQVFDERIRWLEEIMLERVRNILASIVGLFGSIFKIILAPVLSFYILKDLELIKLKALSVLPAAWRDEAVDLFKQIDRVLGSFIKGYLLVAAIVGGMTAVVMALLGVDFALMLGLFAGLTELIPYFGPIIGAVPAVCLALLESKWLAVKVVAAFFIIHQLEGNIISPKILGDKVGLHPLVVIFSLLAGGELYGLTGMLLAVPAAAVLRVIFNFIFLKTAAWL